MKKINFMKIFLITILAITWIVTIDYCIKAIIEKDGYEKFMEKMDSFPDSLAVSVWESDCEPEETYQKLVKQYGENENVTCVLPLYEWLEFSCNELKEETGREVLLCGRVYGEMLETAVDRTGVQELGLYEIIIPKYFKPCNIGRYGNKSYMDGEEWVGKTITLEGYSYEFQVVGTYDNIEIGLEGNQVLYSFDTYCKMMQEKKGLSEQETHEYIDSSYSYVQVFATDAKAKENLIEEMKKEYEGEISEDITFIDLTQWHQEMDTKAFRAKLFVLIGVVITVVSVSLILLLLKKETGICRILGGECLLAVLGLVIGIIHNYQYIKQENINFQANPEEMIRLLEYPVQPLYYISAAAVVIGLIGIGLIRMKKRQVKQNV